jgi:zinc protease
MRRILLMGATLFFGTLPLAEPTRAHGASTPPVERAVLPNGLRILVIRQPHLPMVVVSALVDAGGRFDPDGKEGLASLTASLLTEGTEKRSAAQIHDAVDVLGAKLSAAAGDDYASVSLTVLRKGLAEGFNLFCDVLLHPKFAKPEFERKRHEALAELEADEQNPGSVAERAFRKVLFGTGPYRSEPSGWKESVAKLAIGDVGAFFQAAYQPQRTILVASGDTTLAEMSDLTDRLLGGWKGSASEAKLPAGRSRATADLIRINRDLTQANVVFGHLGTTRDDPDWYAIQVMNYILGGGGFSSRMMNSIRIEAGLVYSVFSYFVPGKLPGSFQVVLQTKSATTAEALRRVREEIERMRSRPVSDEELTSAKKYLTGSFPLRFDSDAEMVGFYSQVEFYGLGLDYPNRYDDLINAITKDDILRVAKKYLHPDEAIVVIVGNQADIQLPAN